MFHVSTFIFTSSPSRRLYFYATIHAATALFDMTQPYLRIADPFYSMAEPPVTIQQARAATVKAPVYTLPVRR